MLNQPPIAATKSASPQFFAVRCHSPLPRPGGSPEGAYYVFPDVSAFGDSAELVSCGMQTFGAPGKHECKLVIPSCSEARHLLDEHHIAVVDGGQRCM